MPATKVKERPILMNGEMVRAVLDGRKTQTRRIMKPQPRLGRYGNGKVISEDYFVWDCPGDAFPTPVTKECMQQFCSMCPHGDIGHRKSIHVPRRASRITLEITDVRVERIRNEWVWVIEFRRCTAE